MNVSPIPWNVLCADVGVGILTEGWNLADGVEVGDVGRSFVVPVTFAVPFAAVPVVQLGLSGFDIDGRDSGRITLKAASVSADGFSAVISTWAGTRVYAVEFHWLAIGA